MQGGIYRRGMVWAGDRAVAATDATHMVDLDQAEPILMHGARRTHLHAGRLVAMVAGERHVVGERIGRARAVGAACGFAAFAVDDAPIQMPGLKRMEIHAGHHAGAAPGAARVIEIEAKPHVSPVLSRDTRTPPRAVRSSAGTATRRRLPLYPSRTGRLNIGKRCAFSHAIERSIRPMHVRTAQLREKERPRHRQFAPCTCRGRYDDGPCTDRNAPEEKTPRPFRILEG